MKVTERYVEKASNRHHAVAHESLLNGLGISRGAKEAIVNGPWPDVAHLLETNESVRRKVASLPEDEQVEAVNELHGADSHSNQDADSYIAARGRERMASGDAKPSSYGVKNG